MNLRIFVVHTDKMTAHAARSLCRAADAAHAARYASHADSQGAQTSLAANVLLRYGAAQMLRVPMHCVTTASGENGQPLLPGTGLFCSVSHTDTLCICAVADVPVGIDAEKIRPAPLRVAQRIFSPQEQQRLRDASQTDRVFFEIWTRHESVVKLTGAGLRDIRAAVPDNVRTQTFLLEEAFAVSLSTFTDAT